MQNEIDQLEELGFEITVEGDGIIMESSIEAELTPEEFQQDYDTDSLDSLAEEMYENFYEVTYGLATEFTLRFTASDGTIVYEITFNDYADTLEDKYITDPEISEYFDNLENESGYDISIDENTVLVNIYLDFDGTREEYQEYVQLNVLSTEFDTLRDTIADDTEYDISMVVCIFNSDSSLIYKKTFD